MYPAARLLLERGLDVRAILERFLGESLRFRFCRSQDKRLGTWQDVPT